MEELVIFEREWVNNTPGIESAVPRRCIGPAKGFAMAKKGKQILICQFAVCVILATGKNCTALPVDLGDAGLHHWTGWEMGTGSSTQSAAMPASAHRQRRGAHAARRNNSSAQFASAHLSFASGESANSITAVSDSPQRMLEQGRIDAPGASAAARALPPSSTLSLINLNRHSLTLGAGVYNLASLQLSRSVLTLSGPGNFVFNIASVFALKSARILLAGGATEANVLFNYTGTNNLTLTKFGRRGGASVLHGIVLALNARVNLAPGLVIGDIISGKGIAMGAGSMVIDNVPNGILPSTPKRVTVPDRGSTFVLVLIALGGLIAFRSSSVRLWHKSAPARR